MWLAVGPSSWCALVVSVVHDVDSRRRTCIFVCPFLRLPPFVARVRLLCFRPCRHGSATEVSARMDVVVGLLFSLPPNPFVCCCVMVAVRPQTLPHLMATSGGPSLPPPVVRSRAAAAVLPPPVKPRKLSPVAAVAAVYADVRYRPPATQATTMRFRVCVLPSNSLTPVTPS